MLGVLAEFGEKVVGILIGFFFSFFSERSIEHSVCKVSFCHFL